MTVSSVNGVGSTGTTTPTTPPKTAAPMDGLGQDAFLQLLLAQLQNQDPLKPMEDKDFIAQLAQFNSLSQLTQMNRTLETFINAQPLTQGSALIGKIVSGMSTTGQTVSGLVSGLTITGDKVTLDVGGSSLPLERVHSVQEANNGGQSQSTTPTTGTTGVTG